MKRILAGAIFALVSFPLALTAADSGSGAGLETTKDKVSYSIGLDLGTYLTSMKGKVDFDILKQGLDDGFSGAEPKLSAEEMAAAQQEFAAEIQAEQEAQLAEMKEKNSAAGEAYLEENKKKEGVVTTGRAISINAFAVVAGFAVLLFSGFPLIRTFGSLIMMSILFCLICALLLVPAMLLLRKPGFLGISD